MLKFKELVDENNLQSAISHGAKAEELFNNSYSIELLNPRELLNKIGLDMTPTKELEPIKIVAFIISQGGDSDYDWLGLLTNPIPPVIVVEHNLMDGIHRCIAAAACKSLVKAAVWKRK